MEKINNSDLEDFLDGNIDLDMPATAEDFENSQLFDTNKIPDSMMENSDLTSQPDPLLVERQNLKLGLTPEDIKELYLYMSGRGEKPLFIDKFTTDTEGKIKDMIYVMNLIQLSSLPMLVAIQNQVRERLYNQENIYSMDIKDLTAASANLTKEIHGILGNATNAVQTLSQIGSLNNKYRQMLDRLTLMPGDKIDKAFALMFEED